MFFILFFFFFKQKTAYEIRLSLVGSEMCIETGLLGYLEEEGANKSSNTETFVAIRVDIDNWRWAGVPFYLRTGKRLPTKCSEVVVYFKTPELNLFKETWQELPQNKLTIRLQPPVGCLL